MGQILELSDQGDLPGVVSEQPAGVLGGAFRALPATSDDTNQCMP